MSQEGFSKTLLMIVALIAITGGAGYFFTFAQPSPSPQASFQAVDPTDNKTTAQTETLVKQPTVSTSANPKDSIRVVSPNGSETYRVGDKVSVSSIGGHQSDTGGIEVMYSLVDNSGKSKDISAGGNSFEWTVSAYSDGTAIVPGIYKIRASSSFGPCPNAECAQTIQDDSDDFFAITQGSTAAAAGILEGTATISANMTYSDAMLSVNKREETTDPSRNTPYTLTNVGVVETQPDGTYSMNLAPGTYWIELARYNSPSENGTYDWPKVVGLPKTVTIKSGEILRLDYSIDTSH